MEQRNDSIRTRLLARLPQPENVAAYREETASLLAKHARAMFWEKVTARTMALIGVAVFMLVNSNWGFKLDRNQAVVLDVIAGVFYFLGAIYELGCQISRSKVDLLKEVKQVQLQVLELQASLKKSGSQSHSS
jgi:hypothetical protein